MIELLLINVPLFLFQYGLVSALELIRIGNFILATRVKGVESEMDKMTTAKFDPEEHQNNVYEAFAEFVAEFTL